MNTNAGNRPWDLRVEHLDEAFGICTTTPRLSWKLPSNATWQLAYRVRAGEWDSGRVDSADNILVPYAGPPLGSRARVDWQVQVWTDEGISEWSTPSSWEMGLLDPSDWAAQWITPKLDIEIDDPWRRPAYLLRATWEQEADASFAQVYATAHGLYELFLNGARVGDIELTPGYTSYRSRLQVQTYDITTMLRQGTNELCAVLSDGWYRGQVGAMRIRDLYGAHVSFLAQVEAGGVPALCTGPGWSTARSGVVTDLMEGQITDLRVRDDGLTWAPARVVENGFDTLCASEAPPVRRVEVIRPAAVTKLEPGRHVVDLGQNINGWLRLRDIGPRETTLTLTHGESLDEAGDLTMEHLAGVDWQTQQPFSSGQVDTVISDGATTSFEPRHTTHGFRYARIEGHPGELDATDVDGVVVHTDMRRTGWFTCSNPAVNRLHEAAEWSFRTNACDIPTDCPQRERSGWTGDWQIFAPTAAFLYDVAGFSTKWLRDLAADQRADGAVRNFAPDIAAEGADSHPIKTFLEGSAGWGDAAVLVPWAMWRAYADRRLLEEQWPSMVAWVEYQTTIAETQRHQTRIDRRSSPAPHERYLWDTGFHWGEWCEPDRLEHDHFANLGDDFGVIATAYFAHSTDVLGKVARVIGRPDDADRYEELASNVKRAWCTEFLDDNGDVRSARQADLVRALAFNLVPDEVRDQTATQLVKLIRNSDTHLNTGFLATPMLLPTLADAGHLDVAYELLLQTSSPSWLAMIERGATTIWEHWEGIDRDRVPRASLNHYSKGAVISFLHEYVAGIRLLDDGPAYRRFRIAPMPGGSVTAAEAMHDSPYGRIESSWSISGDEMRLTVRVPPNTTAVVELPDGSTRAVMPGTAVVRSSTKRARK